MRVNPEMLMIELEKASEGLLYMSESDYEIKPFYWKGTSSRIIDEATILELTGLSTTSIVETEEVDIFFRNSIIDQHWHGNKQKDIVERFRLLLRLLKENLQELKVFRIGSVEIDVFIVGRTISGDLAGISTRVVET